MCSESNMIFLDFLVSEYSFLDHLLYFEKYCESLTAKDGVLPCCSIHQQHWPHLGAHWESSILGPDPLNQNVNFNKVPGDAYTH